MPILPVVVAGDTFASVWHELARENDLELRTFGGVSEITPAEEFLPPLIVVAGREEQAESDLHAARTAGLPAPILVGTIVDHRYVISVVRAGALDYIALPADLPSLQSLVAEWSDRIRRRSDRRRLLETSRTDYDFAQIVGRSPAIQTALERVARVIPHGRASVLVTGETGTGKELIARAIHYNGPRAMGAFVEINCAAIPGNLLESELFGYERGAFTDARSAKPGLFEAADAGTLFLDEIGHMSLTVQGKLLKAIEEKRVRRLGSLEVREFDVRVIAATHVDLAAAVEHGEFREDLYYRLSIIPIELPPLRERGEDVLLIAEHLLEKLSQQYGVAAPPIDPAVRSALLAHPWPGNVRELRNTMERALLLGGGRLDAGDLFLGTKAVQRSMNGPLPFPAPLSVIEREAARAMVERFNGNKSAAANALNISRSRLYRLLGEAEEELPELPSALPR